MAESVVQDAQGPQGGQTDAQAFIDVIKDYEQEFSKWMTRSKKIVERYRDEREIQPGVSSKFNILWSNIQTATPLLFSQVPKPIVERRYDKTAPNARVASLILESTLKTNMDDCDFEGILRQVVEDYLLTARGTLWGCYEPEFSDTQMQMRKPVTMGQGGKYVDNEGTEYEGDKVEQGDDGNIYGLGNAFNPLAYERAYPLYVHYSDFGHNVARYWQEVWCVWRKVRYTKKECIKLFGEELGNKIPLTEKYKGNDAGATVNRGKKALVYEIWDSTDKKVKYVNLETSDQILLTKDDPYKLDKFFPCPKPLFATTTNEQLVPVPDYAQYQDQANELDDITARISNLVKALKLVGIYAGDQKSTITKMLDASSENKLIPVQDWLTIQGSGGITKVIEWMPLDMVGQTLMRLYDARDRVKQTIYEITGFADIMRGASDPRETLGAQQMKGKFGTLRINDKQKAVARFSRDMIDIMGQIICNQFDPKTLMMASGIEPQPMPPAPPAPPGTNPVPQTGLPDGCYFESAVQLLKNGVARHFSIDIEADSTIMPDLEADKAATSEFLTAIGGFIEKSLPAVQQAPELAPLLGQMLLMGVRRFRAGRSLESSVEAFVQKLDEKAQQMMNAPPTPQPNPELEVTQAEANARAGEIKLQHQADMEQIQAKTQGEIVKQHVKGQQDAAADARGVVSDQINAKTASEAEGGPANQVQMLTQTVQQLAQMVQQQGQALQTIMGALQQSNTQGQGGVVPPLAPQ